MSNKIFVARDIDNADVEALFVRRVQNEVSETELNRNSARLFLRQSVWIGACERFDERAFSMVNVTRRCENKMFFCHFVATKGHEQHEELEHVALEARRMKFH